MKINTYKIYFSQVNQTKFEINAINESNAIAEAIRQWRKENATPIIVSIESEDEDENI